MAFKSLVINDPHFRFGFQKPVGRTETFEDDIRDKINCLIEYGMANEIKNLIISGDIFDKKRMSDYSFNQVYNNIAELRKLKQHFNIYSIAGNHDLPFSSVDSKEKSMYWMVTKDLNVLTDIESNQPVDFGCVKLWGLDYRIPESWNTYEPLLIDLNQKMQLNVFNIVVLHVGAAPMLYQKPEFLKMLRYEDLMMFDKVGLFIFGHHHTGLPLAHNTLPDGRKQWYLNTWGFTRLARDESSTRHTPQFSVIEVLDKAVINPHCLKTIDIFHRPWEEAFIEDEANVEKKLSQSLKDFTEEMKKFKTDEEELISEELRELANTYFEMAEEQ